MKGLVKCSKSGLWRYQRTVRIPPELAFNPAANKCVIRGSTYEDDYDLAVEVFLKVIAKAKQELEEGPRRKVYTVRDGLDQYEQTRTTRQAQSDAAFHIETIDRFLGDVPLRLIHTNHPKVKEMIKYSLDRGNAAGTINKRLGVLSHILRLANTEWRDEANRAWIDTPGSIKPLPDNPVGGYPLTGGQERALLSALPDDLADISSFAIHTGLRDRYIRGLRWDQEVYIRGVGSVFDIGNKNGIPHRVVLNSIAAEIIERKRGEHDDFVFTHNRLGLDGVRHPFISPFNRMLFKRAVSAVGLSDARGKGHGFRFHDFRHTFATRLKAMDVPHRTIQDLMGHANGSVTAHYTAVETTNLLLAVERLVEWYDQGPTLFVRKTGQAA